MIEVKVTLDSFGQGITRTELATIIIYNDATGTPSRGNYKVEVYGKSKQLMRTKEIKNWPRKQRHVVDLLAEALA